MGEYSGAARSPPSFLRPSAALPGLVVRVQERDLKTGPGTGPHAAPSGVAVTRDGTRLAYALHGDGKNGIALIHSLAMDRRFWQPVAEQLASIMPVLTFDCRGHGQSDKPSGALYGRALRPRSRRPARSRRLEQGARRRRLHGRLHRAGLCGGLPRAYLRARSDRYHGVVRSRRAAAMGRPRRQGRERRHVRAGRVPDHALVRRQVPRRAPRRRRALRRRVPGATTCKPMSRPAGCWAPPTCARHCRC